MVGKGGSIVVGSGDGFILVYWNLFDVEGDIVGFGR